MNDFKLVNKDVIIKSTKVWLQKKILKLLDVSNQAHLHLKNVKEIIEKLQNEINYFKSKVQLLKIEKKRLNSSNRISCTK